MIIYSNNVVLGQKIMDFGVELSPGPGAQNRAFFVLVASWIPRVAQDPKKPPQGFQNDPSRVPQGSKMEPPETKNGIKNNANVNTKPIKKLPKMQ